MCVIECDRKDCSEQFRSASNPNVVDAQAAASGWALIEIEDPRALAWEKKVLCPAHRPTRGGTINGRRWRERSAKGQAGSVSGQQKSSGDLR
jgi:hypothetical protein